MKTIVVLLLLLLTAADIYIPKDSLLRTITGTKQTSNCSIIYSDEAEGMVFEDQSAGNCLQIEITALPPLNEGTVPFKIAFTKGSYTLKRSLSVGLNVGFDFEIEDLLTGQVYDLKTETPYKFNVSRTIPDRFVMHVKKQQGGVTHK